MGFSLTLQNALEVKWMSLGTESQNKSGNNFANRFPKIGIIKHKTEKAWFCFISEKGNLWCIEIAEAEKSKYCCLHRHSYKISMDSQKKVKFGNRQVNSCDALFNSLFHFKNIVRQPFDFVFWNIQYAHVEYVYQLLRKFFELVGGDSQSSKLLEVCKGFERRLLQPVVVDEQFLDQMTWLQYHFRHDVQSRTGNIHSPWLGNLRRCLQKTETVFIITRNQHNKSHNCSSRDNFSELSEHREA